MSSDVIRDRIDAGPFVPTMLLVLGIGFLLNLVDGFNVVAMSVAAPSLTLDWAITDKQKGLILSAALFGMAIGAALLAPWSDVLGRRKMILLATATIGASMIVTGYIPHSVQLLVAVRIVSGLGIGVIMASGAAIACEFVPERYRNVAVTSVIMGYPFGAMVVGPTANVVMAHHGWEMLFINGGIATLLLGCLLLLALPESVEFLALKATPTAANLAQLNATLRRLRRTPLNAFPARVSAPAVKSVRVASLFAEQRTLDTLFLWTIYFLGFLTLYFFMAWIPSLFVNAGFTRSQGVYALTVHNLGAVVGIVAIGLLTTRMRLAKPICISYLGAAICLAWLYGYKPASVTTLNRAVFIIGVLLQGGFTAMYALAARIYPTAIRATGIGWAAGLGRTGAIVSPTVAGFLAASGWNFYDLSLLFAVPLLVAAALVLRFRI